MVYYPQIKPERGITMKNLLLYLRLRWPDCLHRCADETATVPAAADPPRRAATEENADAEQFRWGAAADCL